MISWPAEAADEQGVAPRLVASLGLGFSSLELGGGASTAARATQPPRGLGVSSPAFVKNRAGSSGEASFSPCPAPRLVPEWERDEVLLLSRYVDTAGRFQPLPHITYKILYFSQKGQKDVFGCFFKVRFRLVYSKIFFNFDVERGDLSKTHKTALC